MKKPSNRGFDSETHASKQHTDSKTVSDECHETYVSSPVDQLISRLLNSSLYSTGLNLDYWVEKCQATLSSVKANRRTYNSGSTELRRSKLTNPTSTRQLAPASPHPELIPLIENPNLLRCSHCYRTFRPDVALRHVDTCSRKTMLNGGEAPNALGSVVATGISTNQLRSRQTDLLQSLILSPRLGVPLTE
ncbi:unnamed protein product [Echinostoma caproni]|uniref:Zinc finger C2HC domain-containing protein 1B n=1 Tax=Echinostoma caproni TaxID=27848 RepID=A0A183AK01_9TREM|nr:unnamed protein product [Echinostoma caproni]